MDGRGVCCQKQKNEGDTNRSIKQLVSVGVKLYTFSAFTGDDISGS